MINGSNTLEALLEAANSFPGAQVHHSTWSSALGASAQANSEQCCFLQRGGHHNWGDRFQALVGSGLAKSFGEINAESWKRQENCTPVELWLEAFRCWKQSKGHWSMASKRYHWFGSGIAKSSRGIYYMTIIAGGDAVAPTVPDYKVF